MDFNFWKKLNILYLNLNQFYTNFVYKNCRTSETNNEHNRKPIIYDHLFVNRCLFNQKSTQNLIQKDYSIIKYCVHAQYFGRKFLFLLSCAAMAFQFHNTKRNQNVAVQLEKELFTKEIVKFSKRYYFSVPFFIRFTFICRCIQCDDFTTTAASVWWTRR